MTPDIDYYLIEVDYSQIADEAQRDYLNNIPTAFKLKREQVDTLRAAAGRILDTNPSFQQLLSDLKQ